MRKLASLPGLSNGLRWACGPNRESQPESDSPPNEYGQTMDKHLQHIMVRTGRPSMSVKTLLVRPYSYNPKLFPLFVKSRHTHQNYPSLLTSFHQLHPSPSPQKQPPPPLSARGALRECSPCPLSASFALSPRLSLPWDRTWGPSGEARPRCISVNWGSKFDRSRRASRLSLGSQARVSEREQSGAR